MTLTPQIKVIMLGDSGVGKTSLVQRYIDGVFHDASIGTTIGIDYRHKIMNISEQNYKVEFWDTAGQERFRGIAQSYIRGADAILLLYDSTKYESFVPLRKWAADIQKFANTKNGGMNEMREKSGSFFQTLNSSTSLFKGVDTEQMNEKYVTNPIVCLISNKRDLSSKVKFKEAKALARELDFDFCFSVSAKTGEGVNDAFRYTIEKVVKSRGQIIQERHERTNLVTIDQRNMIDNESSCC